MDTAADNNENALESSDKVKEVEEPIDTFNN